MRAIKPRRGPLTSKINITPLIDVLLVLIVIFMVITPVTPKGFDTNVPIPPRNNVVKAPEHTLVLDIDANGVVRLNREELDAASLFPRLQDVLRTRADRSVFVQADNDMAFDKVAQVIDIVHGAGADRIGLLTAPIAGR